MVWKKQLAEILDAPIEKVEMAIKRANMSFSDYLSLSQAVKSDPPDLAKIRELLLTIKEQDNPYAQSGSQSAPTAVPDTPEPMVDLTPGTKLSLPDGRTASVKRELSPNRAEVVIDETQQNEIVDLTYSKPMPKARAHASPRQRKK